MVAEHAVHTDPWPLEQSWSYISKSHTHLLSSSVLLSTHTWEKGPMLRYIQQLVADCATRWKHAVKLSEGLFHHKQQEWEKSRASELKQWTTKLQCGGELRSVEIV